MPIVSVWESGVPSVVQLQRLKKLATIAGTFAFALLIGFVMQYGDADASRFTVSDAADQFAATPAALDPSPLERTTILLPKTAASPQLSTNGAETVRFEPEQVKLTALVDDGGRALLGHRNIYSVANHDDTPSCPIDISSAVGPDATVALDISSPCRADMAFVLHHNDLVITGLTDDDGIASLTMPAFEVNSTYGLTFADGTIATTSVAVPDAQGFNHVVLQWADLPGDYIRRRNDVTEPAGSILRLGQDTGGANRFAEIYTLAASQQFETGLQDLTLQAYVTPANCAQLFLAERFHVRADAETQRKDIQITLPTCDYAGTYLELKKVLGGQTLLP